MKRKFISKKFLAMGLAATFALSSVTGTFATEPTTEVSTETEATEVTKQTKVINITLNNEDGTVYDNFILDPIKGYTLMLPELAGDETREFAGWRCNWDNQVYKGTADLSACDWEYVSFSPVFNEINKTVTVNFNAYDGGSFDGESVVTQIVTNNDTVAFPELTVNEGYKHVGWLVSGKETAEWTAETHEVGGVFDLAHFSEGSNEGYLSITALFEASEQPAEKTVTVSFNAYDGGNFNGENVVTKEVTNNDTVAFPELTVNEGYKHVGWRIEGKETAEWTAETHEVGGVFDLAYFSEGSKEGYLNITALFETSEQPAEKTVTVSFNAYDGGSFNGEDVVTQIVTNNDTVAFPELTVNEGYKHVGWRIEGKETAEWTAETHEVGGVLDLAHFSEGSKEGYLSITALFEASEQPAEKTVTLNFNAYDGGSFNGKNVVTKTTTNNDIVAFPELTVNEGYKHVGWLVSGKETAEWSAETHEIGGALDLAYFAEGSKEGYLTITAIFESEAAEKTVTLNFNAYDGGSFNGANVVTKTVTNNDTVAFPELTVNEGYKHVGWLVSGKETAEWSAETYEIGGVLDLAHYAEGSKEGYLTITAIFESEAAEKTVTLNFNAYDGGSFNGANVVTKTVTNNDTVAFPELTVNEGYKHVGWLVSGKETAEWSAETYEVGGVLDLAHFPEGSKEGYLTITALFEASEQPVEKTVILNFNAYDGGSFNGENVVTKEVTSNDTVAFPELTVNEGYKHVGWLVSGKETAEWSAETYEVGGVLDLAHFPEGSKEGYLTITAVFESEAAEKTVILNFNAYDGGSFNGENVVTKEVTSNDAVAFPELTVNEGYKHVGWLVSGKEEIEWDAAAFEIGGVLDLAYFPEGSKEGYLTITALFEKNARNVYVNFNAYDGGSFDGENVVTMVVPENEKIAFPELTVNEGYKLVGWTVSGKEEVKWDAAAFEIGGLDLLAFFPEGSEVGYITITANFEETEPQTETETETETEDMTETEDNRI